MLAYAHKYLCYSTEQSLKRNEVSTAATRARARKRSYVIRIDIPHCVLYIYRFYMEDIVFSVKKSVSINSSRECKYLDLFFRFVLYIGNKIRFLLPP